MVASTSDPSPTVTEPFPIFMLAHRYLLYDIAVISHIRAVHNVPGVLIGLLPQAPQQNVFSGIPLELMPEEARLLCEKGVAYMVDDVKAHRQGFLDRGTAGMGEEESMRFWKEGLRRQGVAAARQVREKAEGRKMAAMQRKVESGGSVENWNDLPEDMLRPALRARKKKGKKGKQGSGTAMPIESVSGEMANGDVLKPEVDTYGADDEEASLFGSPMNSFPAKASNRSRPTSSARRREPEPYGITPITSYPPLSATPPPRRSRAGTPLSSPEPPVLEEPTTSELPEVPASYPLYKHLHSKDYFLMPGLRFGCQYTAYPGDPLRFHSHFLCNGMDWDQEFDLLDLVTGGRMGTGVKKGYLIGGIEKKDAENGRVRQGGKGDGSDSGEEQVRTFCVEWGGM